MFIETIICTNLIMAAAQPVGPPQVSLSLEAVLPPGLYLVKAHALEATPLGKPQPAWGRLVAQTPFEIDHIYVGPADLKGKEFTARLYEAFINFNMPTETGMPVAKGEQGIFWIEKSKGGLEATNGGERLAWVRIVSLPALREGPQVEPKFTSAGFISRNYERGGPNYEMAVAKAEVCEKVYHASEKDRIKVIDDFLRSGDSVRAAASLALLLNANTPKPAKSPKEQPVIEMNQKIADYVLPLSRGDAALPRVQREVDQLLLRNKQGWADSPERFKMYQRWAGGDWKEKNDVPWDASEEKAVADALTYVNPPFSLSQTVELGIIGVANPARSDRFKTQLVRATAWSLKSQDSREVHSKGISEVLDTMCNERAPEKRVAAAKLLVVFIPFSVQQRQTIESLRKQKLGDAVTKEIEKALAEK
jgi:hypothetical protein